MHKPPDLARIINEGYEGEDFSYMNDEFYQIHRLR
jgi:hypothetical protein